MNEIQLEIAVNDRTRRELWIALRVICMVGRAERLIKCNRP